MQFSANETVQAICRTLFHSLWQGVLLAIAGGLVVMFTKKLRAAVRYNILTALLVVFVAGAVSTFCYQLNSFVAKPIVTEAMQAATPIKIVGNTQFFQTTVDDVKPVTIKSAFVGWLTANAGIIVLAWLLVIAFRCVQMLVGLRGVYILRHKGLSDAGDYWVSRLNQLAASIQLTKPIRLMQSAIAKVPMVTGHLKPIILLPLGVLTVLPQDEIEAILLHELAHIRRKDYLVNMLQNVCEIIFFFNPAVLWVSSLIKDERENCCDDIAIGEVKNKKQFIHALISFQEYNLAANNYAVGFPGRKDHLLNRVKRIITNNNKSLTNMEKTFLATGIVILSFITIAFAHNKQVHERTKQTKDTKKEAIQANKDSVAAAAQTSASPAEAEAVDAPAPPVAVDSPTDDTTKQKKDINISSISSNTNNEGHQTLTMNTEFDGKEYKIVQKDGKLTALYVDGERVPDDKIDSYKPVLDQIKAAMKEQQLKQFAQQKIQVKEQQEQFQEQEERFREQQTQYEKQQAQYLKLADANANAEYKQQLQQSIQQYKEQEERYREQQKQYEKQFEDQQAKIVQQEEEYKKQIEQGNEFIVGPIAPLPPIAPIGPIAPIAPIPPMETAGPIAPVPPIAPRAPLAPRAPIAPIAPIAPTDNKTINAIISVLEDENIITDEDNMSFSLNNTELIVNGVKQPDALQARLKKEYFKSSKDYIKYSSKKHNGGKSTNSDISIESK